MYNTEMLCIYIYIYVCVCVCVCVCVYNTEIIYTVTPESIRTPSCFDFE